jgi:hypothetical protein
MNGVVGRIGIIIPIIPIAREILPTITNIRFFNLSDTEAIQVLYPLINTKRDWRKNNIESSKNLEISIRKHRAG